MSKAVQDIQVSVAMTSGHFQKTSKNQNKKLLL